MTVSSGKVDAMKHKVTYNKLDLKRSEFNLAFGWDPKFRRFITLRRECFPNLGHGLAPARLLRSLEYCLNECKRAPLQHNHRLTGGGIDTLTYNISLRHSTRFTGTHKDRQKTKTLHTTEKNVTEKSVCGGHTK